MIAASSRRGQKGRAAELFAASSGVPSEAMTMLLVSLQEEKNPAEGEKGRRAGRPFGRRAGENRQNKAGWAGAQNGIESDKPFGAARIGENLPGH